LKDPFQTVGLVKPLVDCKKTYKYCLTQEVRSAACCICISWSPLVEGKLVVPCACMGWYIYLIYGSQKKCHKETDLCTPSHMEFWPARPTQQPLPQRCHSQGHIRSDTCILKHWLITL
jgi:hypothetical protein